jgi:hypothetical protein
MSNALITLLGIRKNQNDFLGHIEDKTVNKTIRKARTMKGRTPLTKAEDDALTHSQISIGNHSIKMVLAEQKIHELR